MPGRSRWPAPVLLPDEFDDTGAPDALVCPITQEVMTDPVRAADGQVYERAELQQWFDAGRDTSPLTNAPMPTELRADLTMRALCAGWM